MAIANTIQSNIYRHNKKAPRRGQGLISASICIPLAWLFRLVSSRVIIICPMKPKTYIAFDITLQLSQTPGAENAIFGSVLADKFCVRQGSDLRARSKVGP